MRQNYYINPMNQYFVTVVKMDSLNIDIENMDIESLYELYNSNPNYNEKIEEAIAEKPKILLNFSLHPQHQVPTLKSLRCLIKMACVLGRPEISDQMLEAFQTLYDIIWFPKHGITHKVEETIEILDADYNVDDEIIWTYIQVDDEERAEFVGRLVNPQ